MSKAKAKQAPKGVACPICIAAFPSISTPENTAANMLRLDEESGNYVCAVGHSLTVEELRASLENAAKTGQNEPQNEAIPTDGAPPIPEGISDPVSMPNSGLEAAEKAAESRAENGEKKAATDPDFVPEPDEKEAILDVKRSRFRQFYDMETTPESTPKSSRTTDADRLLPNGDVAVTVILAEGHYGPVGELALAEGQTVSIWLSGNVELWLNDLFSSSFSR